MRTFVVGAMLALCCGALPAYAQQKIPGRTAGTGTQRFQQALHEAARERRLVEEMDRRPAENIADKQVVTACHRQYLALWEQYGVQQRVEHMAPQQETTIRASADDLEALWGIALCTDAHARLIEDNETRHDRTLHAAWLYSRYDELEHRTAAQFRNRVVAARIAAELIPQGKDVVQAALPADAGALDDDAAAVERTTQLAVLQEQMDRVRAQRAAQDYRACSATYASLGKRYGVDRAAARIARDRDEFRRRYASNDAARGADSTTYAMVDPAVAATFDLVWGTAVCEHGVALELIDAGAGGMFDPNFPEAIERLERARDRYEQYVQLEFRREQRQRVGAAHAKYEKVSVLLDELQHQSDPLFRPRGEALPVADGLRAPASPEDRPPIVPEPDRTPVSADVQLATRRSDVALAEVVGVALEEAPARTPAAPYHPAERSGDPDADGDPSAPELTPEEDAQDEPRYRVVYEHSLICGAYYMLHA
ncbi:MAG: hypothetical protein Q7T01_03835, partial [bacterium]|nr:hypothetical protein [bacterium]